MTPTLTDITIIIPCYNVAPYVQATLDSVSAQTATYQGILECLLIDDGSTDQTAAICQSFIDGYAGSICFRLLRQPHNMGVSAARNLGIRKATGRYLYFMDGDDSLVADGLVALWSRVEEHPNVEMVYAGMTRTDGDRWMSYKGRSLPDYTEDRHEIKIEILGCERLTVSCCNKLYLRELIVENKLFFDETLRKHEDDLWNNLLAKHVTRLAALARDTYIYKVHPGSLTTTNEGIDSMLNRLIVEERIIRTIDEPYKPEQIRRALIQEFYYYLNNEDRSIRQRIGQLHLLMVQHCPFRQRLLLRLLSVLTRLDHGNRSVAFKLYRRLRHYTLK